MMAVNSSKIDQVEAPTAAAVPDGASFLEQLMCSWQCGMGPLIW